MATRKRAIMAVDKVMKAVYAVIGNTKKEGKTQDPDEIVVRKQWSEFGAFKGYWVDVTYYGKKGYKHLVISFDATPHYMRVLGSPEKIPVYTPGTHNYPDTSKYTKKELNKIKEALAGVSVGETPLGILSRKS